ncbi:MAG: redox-regulated ATPase YchF [Candidatus Hermodarchaeota archaeon]|nr:redox-regulated ATPase YchF [Candidatus Hermodarchaeota archaeon]
MLVGIVGKPSSGKSTFLNASCRTSAKVGAYPFTTIEPNPGTAYVRVDCLCQEFGVKCNAKNSICRDGVRLIPIDMLDVAGLVPDAHQGRGRGNQFLDDLRRADAFIHVVDASGSLDSEGREVEPGTWNPQQDVEFLEHELTMWLVQILQRDWRRLSRRAETEKQSISALLGEKLSGLQITEPTIRTVIRKSELTPEKPTEWSEADLEKFVHILRRQAKPMVIAANKVDRPQAAEYIDELLQHTDEPVIPCTAAGELALRDLSEKGVIDYIPGGTNFTILQVEALGEREQAQLNRLQEEILNKYGSTGVQQVLNIIVFDVLKLIAVYPVEDAGKLSDHDGNVLPDVYLVPQGTTARQLAYKIHTDLGETFIHAIDARTKKRLAENYELKANDVIRIVAAGATH